LITMQQSLNKHPKHGPKAGWYSIP